MGWLGILFQLVLTLRLSGRAVIRHVGHRHGNGAVGSAVIPEVPHGSEESVSPFPLSLLE